MFRIGRLTALVSASLVLLTMSCGGGDGGTDPPDTTRNLSILGGNNQTAAAGQAVATAPSVRVTNGSGAPVSGAQVTFTVASGGGTVTGGSQTSDAQGNATVGSWTMGNAAGANTLTASVQGSTSTVTFTATATAAAPAAIQKTAGDNQTAPVKAAVATRPAVRVNDAFGNPVPGATVNFAVTGGGGAVTGGTQTTDAGGVATVGSWTLGPTNGPNQLSATVQGTQIAAAVFAATGQEILVQPSQDTTFQAGTVNLTRLVIAAGRTVTVAGNVTINADSSVVIAGTLTGNCVAITINGAQTVEVTGSISNSCAVTPANPPGLSIIGKGGYSFTGPGEIVTSGDGLVTNDPTLTDADFPASAPAFAPLNRLGSALTHVPCHVQKVFRAPPADDGADGGPVGEPGADGRAWTLQCRGADLELGAGAGVVGQHGGDGGNALHTGNPGEATGGTGGKGGTIKVKSTGRVVITAPVTVQSGNGGHGGSAVANGTAGVGGQKAAGAKATGGAGGEAGVIEVRGSQGIVGAGFLTLQLGNGGSGGSGTATGADGEQGKSGDSDREQDGGDAEAIGGAGGGTPDKQLIQSGNVAGGNPTLTGGIGANGGATVATGGRGADGTADRINGGHGGNIRSSSGKGGDALARNLAGIAFAPGGDGGIANFLRALGADGWDNCVDPEKPAGKGGDGGDATGSDGGGGFGGLGQTGSAGGVVYANNSNGGQGGDHFTNPGAGGAAGDNSVLRTGTETNVDPNFEPGPPGNLCPQLISTSHTSLPVTHVVFVSPCPQLIAVVRVTNTSDVSVVVTRVVVGTNVVSLTGGQGVSVPAGGFVDITVVFNCAQAFSFSGTLRITATPPGGSGLDPQVVDIPITGTLRIRAVRLAQALGGFAANSLIQQNRVTNWLFNPAHVPNCASDHLHSSSLGGILIDGLGPFPDPDPTGCGYGAVELVTLPPLPGPRR